MQRGPKILLVSFPFGTENNTRVFEPLRRLFIFVLLSGSDSAPHPTISKRGGVDGAGKPAAGVFTQPFATQYVLLALEQAIERGIIAEDDLTQELLERFLGGFGRRFYKISAHSSANADNNSSRSRIVLERKGARIPEMVRSDDGSIEVGLIRGGDEIFSLRWESST